MRPLDKRLFAIGRLQEQARNSTTPNPAAAELPGTSKSAGNKKQGEEGPMANMMAHGVSIRPIRAGVFNTFNNTEISTGLDYPLGNSIILDSGSTYNIGNTRSRFNPDSFRPPREDKENAIFASDIIVPIESYRTISITVQTEEFPNSRVIIFRNIVYILLLYISVVSLKFLN